MNAPIKKNPNHAEYIRMLRRMGPEQRLIRAFELSQFARDLFISGLRKLHSDMPEEQFKELVAARLDKCHNRNY